MDARTKRLSITIGLGIILVVAITVLLMNFNTFFDKNDEQTVQVQAESVPDIGEDGRVEGSDLSAFLKDDTFFDHDDKYAEYQTQTDDREAVSMLVTSVEKDIRITIVDNDSMPVTGESFEVTLSGEDEYKDVDQDGIIYITDIRPGEYSVSLNENEDYIVPDKPVEVTVKDSVSYSPIADISYLIKSEDEVNAEIEDTKQEAIDEEDMDTTEYTDIFESNDMIRMGIDVSKWNGEIDWDVVKAQGIDYAIIRCGYRGSATGALVEDPYFETNLQNAKRAGIEVGIYFFTQATNAVEAVEEASMALALVNGIDLEYPVFIDTEGTGGNGRADGLTVEARTDVCNAFCQTIKNAGYTPGIYASRNWYYNNLFMETLDDNYIWLAEYRETPLYDGHYEMWQYSSNGHVEGISTRVDLDISYKK